MRTAMCQLIEQVSTIFRPLKESIEDFISFKDLGRVSVRLPRVLLYFIYRHQKSGLRLLVGIRDIEGTRFQELNVESIVRLRDFLDHRNEDEIDVPLTNGNLVRLRRDDNPYPWLEARKNAAVQGTRLPLFMNLEGSGVDRFVEVPTAAAGLIVNALDGFLSLAGVHKKMEGGRLPRTRD